MTDEPATVDWVGPCDLCGLPASWRSTPKVGDTEFTARVVRCDHCEFVLVDPRKAVPVEKARTAIGWLAERIAG